MTAVARLPDNAPFAPDAIHQLNRVIGASTPAQRHWLAGFLAGIEAVQPQTAAAGPKPKLTVLFATESGNSEALANAARRDAGRLGFAAKLLDAAQATPADLANAGSLLVIASTWGEGEAPQRAERFIKALLAETAPPLPGLRFAVLALGDRAYAQFCETGRLIDARLAALGAERAAPLLECDLDYAAPAATWLSTTLPGLRKAPPGDAPADTSGDAPGASVIHVDFGAAPRPGPFPAEIAALANLNSSRSGKQTLHLELDVSNSGLTWLPGDSLAVHPQNDPVLAGQLLHAVGLADDASLHAALIERHDLTTLTPHLIRQLAQATGAASLQALAADEDALRAYTIGRHVLDLLTDHPVHVSGEQLLGLLRPLAPRLYSIASSQRAAADQIDLLVSTVRYHAHGRDRGGVASTWLADRRRVGDTVPVSVKPNPHFRLPPDGATPIVMIGPGTGVAPFRAFMQERDALGAAGPSWLFFGDRQFTHDFLYQLDWQDLLKRRVLSRLDVAFSRDQPAKRYVQHAITERGAELHAWLQDGAHLYVCGDQAHMARDVHAALRGIVARHGALSDEKAEDLLQAMVAAGRYQRDVY